MSVSLCDTLRSIKISLQVKAKQTSSNFRVSGLLCLPKVALKAQNVFSFRFVIWKKHVESSFDGVHKAPTGSICTRLNEKKSQRKIS